MMCQKLDFFLESYLKSSLIRRRIRKSVKHLACLENNREGYFKIINAKTVERGLECYND